ncbi:MAG: hypothetical protein M3R54_00705 [Chloroflexota bacterium]|nr:hypothetical protein [Chloroflexota bacterium]
MRGYADGVFTSDELPPLRMRVVPELRYLGSFLFDLKGIARVERHIFVETERVLVRRMLVLQFEGFLPHVDDVYRYGLADPRELGGETYGRQASLLSVSAERAESPDAEITHTVIFLESKGLVLPDRHAVARFARIFGERRRRELLIFYHECDGALDGILARAEQSFTLSLVAGPVARR